MSVIKSIGRGFGIVSDFLIPHYGVNPNANFTSEEFNQIEDGLFSSEDIKERLFLLMDEAKEDMKLSMKYSMATFVFILISLATLYVESLWWVNVISLIMAVRYLLMDSSLNRRIRGELGFIDGIMYTCTEITKNFNEAKDSPEAIRNVIKRAEADLKKMGV